MIEPHGGKLKNCMVPPEEIGAVVTSCQTLTRIQMTTKETSDLFMIGNGSFSPLEGFMGKDDYESVIERMCLANGTLWPLPVTLAVTSSVAATLVSGQEVALEDASNGDTVGKMTISDIFSYDKDSEVRSVFGTNDANHPGVAKTNAQQDFYIGGSVTVFSEGIYPQKYPEYARPAETRAIIAERGWKTVAAFQTRNPIHRSHEYLTKIALEVCDGILIHPVVGALKEGDIPAEIRMDCYRTLLENYYPKDRVLLKVYPMEMRYAGPKEAVLHAIIRQNFGCTHMIIGRDHAGVGKYYGPFDAQDIFDNLPEKQLLIAPLKIDWTFWCKACGGVASTKTCPHDKSDHIMISGTDLRKMLTEGKRPSEMISRPEVADILIKYYQSEEKTD